jgi:diacylglycerol kinase family enzyme
MMYKVLFNPLAGLINDTSFHGELKKFFDGETIEYYDITKIADIKAYINSLSKDDKVIIAGGDGTLNRFANDIGNSEFANEIYYYPTGSGNDFWADAGKVKGDKPILIMPYLKNLPTVTVNGKTYKVVNGVGFGVDGYCCEVGDKLKAENKKVNYTGIAIKGLLFHFKPETAEVIVDGERHIFKKTWIAPTMNGRYYGGGMIPTPAQDRFNKEHTISTCVMYHYGRLRTLMLFPNIFKGEHIKNTKAVKVLSGHEITVKFDHPCALQIDGETILNVTEYTMKGSVEE